MGQERGNHDWLRLGRRSRCGCCDPSGVRRAGLRIGPQRGSPSLFTPTPRDRFVPMVGPVPSVLVGRRVGRWFGFSGSVGWASQPDGANQGVSRVSEERRGKRS